jgi:hypothetical protein
MDIGIGLCKIILIMNFKSLLIPLLFTFGTVSAQTYQIHVDQTNQEIDNFGASDCWTMYRFGKYATEANINKVADLLFSKDLDANGRPKGIGLSMWRVNFGAGSDDNVSGNFRDVRARTPCIMKSDGTYDLSLTGKCGGQFNFLKKAKERGCEYTLGFVNSPPYFMTITGQTNGGTTYNKKLNLDNNGIQNFTEYLSEVLRRTKEEHGVTFDYVAPVNEPEWDHSTGEGMNATNNDVKNICVALDSKLTSKNITTKILIPEAGKIQLLNSKPSGYGNYWEKIKNLFGNSSSSAYVGNLSTVARIATAHGYWSAAANTSQLVDLRTPLPSVLSQYNTKYWETEWCIGDESLDKYVRNQNTADLSINYGLMIARLMHCDLSLANASAWQWWLGLTDIPYTDGLLYLKKNGSFDVAHQLTSSTTDGPIEPSEYARVYGDVQVVVPKAFWCFGQYSRWIRPGAHRLTVTSSTSGTVDNITGMMVSSYKNTDGKLVCVMLNYGDNANVVNLTLSDGTQHSFIPYITTDNPDDGMRPLTAINTGDQFNMPPRSIVTFVETTNVTPVADNSNNAFYYTFEDGTTIPTTSIDNYVQSGTLQVASNARPDGNDYSLKCLTFQMQSGFSWYSGIRVNVPSTTTTSAIRYLYMKIRADKVFNTNFTIQLFNGGTEGTVYSPTKATMMDSIWNEYCFAIPSGVTFDQFRVEPRYAGNFYLDDIRLCDVAPVIPNLTPFTIDFERPNSGEGWASNYTGKGATYRSDVNADPYNKAAVLNTSAKCMRIWIENGGYSEYGGARYTGVYGYTTAATRYLHVHYFYNPNDTTAYQSLPLWVFTEDGDNMHASSTNSRKKWNDVTIDLGVGTLVKFLGFTVNGWWITAGIDDIVLNGDPNSRNFSSAYQSGSVEPIVGERAIEYGSNNKATATTTWFGTHYRLTFPGTHISWSQTMPTDYAVAYSTTINGRTITGDCAEGSNAFDLYGIKGQTSAPMTFTYTPTANNISGSVFTETATVPLTYFGSGDITDNGVNIGSIATQLFNNGQAVAAVSATDDKTGGYVPSYYAPMKSASTSDDGTLSDYNNTSIVPVAGSRSIIRVSDMKAQNIYLMNPSFSDVAATTTPGAKLSANVSVNYAVVPHYLMVKTGPYTSSEMASIVKSEAGTINTLQDSWSVSSAPALTLESVGKARIKTVSTTADDLYDNATDVAVASIGSTSYWNHKLVTFIANDLTPTGIEGVSANMVTIIGGEGFISVTGANDAVVYDFTGRMIVNVHNQGVINVPSGLYIVKAGGKISKVKVD